MAATPFPQNLFHVGTARPLMLDAPLQVPSNGDLTFTVSGSASSKGWPKIPDGQKMVVTLARGEPQECKYLVSSISSGQTSSTFTVLAADRNYDNTTPVDAPAGATVEHTISATEMATINDHMLKRRAHGSDGDLVDQDSAQLLTNKTFGTPTLAGHPATKQYVDNAVGPVKVTADAAKVTADAALPKAGGKVTGQLQIVDKVVGPYPEVGNLILHAPTGQVDVRGASGAAYGGQIAHADATYANQSATLGQVQSGDAAVAGVANAAKAAADAAKATADAALPKTGGAISGGLSVSGTTGLSAIVLQDSQTPASGAYDVNNRWLVYKGDGRVHRMDQASFDTGVRLIVASSRRFKDGISPAASIPDVIALRPVGYRWVPDGSREVVYPGDRLGLIAEEVALVDERLVTRDPDGQVQGLDTNALIAALIAKVGDLQNRIEHLEGAR